MKWFVRTWSKAFFPAREEILIVSGSCLAYNETTFSPEMFKKISESLIFPAFPHLRELRQLIEDFFQLSVSCQSRR
jgi:hypothetical protein